MYDSIVFLSDQEKKKMLFQFLVTIDIIIIVFSLKILFNDDMYLFQWKTTEISI